MGFLSSLANSLLNQMDRNLDACDRKIDSLERDKKFSTSEKQEKLAEGRAKINRNRETNDYLRNKLNGNTSDD